MRAWKSAEAAIRINIFSKCAPSTASTQELRRERERKSISIDRPIRPTVKASFNWKRNDRNSILCNQIFHITCRIDDELVVLSSYKLGRMRHCVVYSKLHIRKYGPFGVSSGVSVVCVGPRIVGSVESNIFDPNKIMCLIS